MPLEMLVGLNVTDDDSYTAYRAATIPILEQIGGGFRHDFRIAEVLRSDTSAPINRVFTIHFPDADVRDSFFANDAYRAIKKQYLAPAVDAVFTLAEYTR